jgi:hypothetical protein
MRSETASLAALPPWARWMLLALGVACLATLASINGLWNGFTYDDRFIILGNPVVQDFRRLWTIPLLPYWPIEFGGDGYRPLTLFAFAVQWKVAPGSAFLFHGVSIALHAMTCLSTFWLASLLLPRAHAWLTAALFAVHPVHVEAVANIVGQSELLAALLLITATAWYVQSRRAGTLSRWKQVSIGTLYLAACLAKEHAIMLPAALLCAERLLVRDIPAPARLRVFHLSLLLVAALYLLARSVVIGDSIAGFEPYAPFVAMNVDAGDRVLTMIGLAPQWLRLLLWPAKLSAEYGPPEYPIATGLALWQLPGLLILVGVAGLAFAARKRMPVFTFGVAWTALFLLPSSNVVLPTGILMAERTLFTPSVGAMLALCSLLPLLASHLRSPVTRVAALVGAGAILLMGTEKSIVRTAVWRDNGTLFTTSVREQPNVYRTHYMLGAWLFEQRRYALAERAFLKALDLFSHDPFVAYNLGQGYSGMGHYAAAFDMYALAERIQPGFWDAKAKMAMTGAAAGRLAEAKVLAAQALDAGVGDVHSLRTVMAAAALDERGRQRLLATVREQHRGVVR